MTQTVCLCPSSIMMLVPAAKSSPCNLYTSAQGDLLVVTNACPTTTAPKMMPREEQTHVRNPTSQPHIPEITGAATVQPELVRRQTAKSGSYILTIAATLQCSNNPAVVKTTAVVPTSGASPKQASDCVNGAIAANEAAYTQYDVSVISSYNKRHG